MSEPPATGLPAAPRDAAQASNEQRRQRHHRETCLPQVGMTWER